MRATAENKSSCVSTFGVSMPCFRYQTVNRNPESQILSKPEISPTSRLIGKDARAAPPTQNVRVGRGNTEQYLSERGDSSCRQYDSWPNAKS